METMQTILKANALTHLYLSGYPANGIIISLPA